MVDVVVGRGWLSVVLPTWLSVVNGDVLARASARVCTRELPPSEVVVVVRGRSEESHHDSRWLGAGESGAVGSAVGAAGEEEAVGAVGTPADSPPVRMR